MLSMEVFYSDLFQAASSDKEAAEKENRLATLLDKLDMKGLIQLTQIDPAELAMYQKGYGWQPWW